MSPKPKAFLQRWLLTTLGVLLAAHLVRGITYETITALLAASLLLGILNAVLRPILLLLTLPLLILSLGLFNFVINAGLLYLVGRVIKGFHVSGFWAGFWGGLIISFVSLVGNSMTGKGLSANVRVQVGKPEPKQQKTDLGNGPVIDV